MKSSLPLIVLVLAVTGILASGCSGGRPVDQLPELVKTVVGSVRTVLEEPSTWSEAKAEDWRTQLSKIRQIAGDEKPGVDDAARKLSERLDQMIEPEDWEDESLRAGLDRLLQQLVASAGE